MSEINLLQLQNSIDKLPGLPQVIMQLLTVIDNQNTELTEVADLCSKDAGLAAHILRLANSPFFGLMGDVTSIKDACMVLGVHTIRNAVLAAGVLQRFPSQNGQHLDRLAIWQHSFYAAATTQFIARQLKQNKDTAFTAGLLHDVGKLVLEECFPEKMQQVVNHQADKGGLLHEAEIAIFGFEHAAAGAYVAKQWHFPDTIINAIEQHHRPSSESTAEADIVHLADAIIHKLSVTPDQATENTIPEIEPIVMDKLSIDVAVINTWLPDIEKLASQATSLCE